MKKDKKWAQKEVDKYLSYEGVSEARNALIFAKGVIDQLDEPEVNSQIDKLANFIMSEIEGEPSQSQGAVDTAIRIIKSYQNQETLSEEWIDEHVVYADVRGGTQAFIHVEDLQNLLVPKPELPVVPRVVADYITHKKKSDNSLDGAFVYIKTYGWDDESSYDYEVYEWLNIDSNDETFARAWLDGYEVEGAVFPRTDTIIKEI